MSRSNYNHARFEKQYRAFMLFLFIFTAYEVAFGAESCSKYCPPATSKPCGMSCISLHVNCRKSWTTACVGERPQSAKPIYATPKHVDTPPTN